MAVKKVTPKKATKRSSSKKRFDLQQFLHYFYWVLAIVSVLGAAGVVGFYAGYNQAKDENGKSLFRKRIMEVLDENEEEYFEFLDKHISRHMKLLGLGEKGAENA